MPAAGSRILRGPYSAFTKTMKTPLLAGRFFTPQDVTSQAPRVAIIDETLARRLWPQANPLGRRLTFGRFPEKTESWIEIVGVVKHIRHHRLDADVREQVYFPALFTGMTLAIRYTSDQVAMVGAVRAAVQSLDRDQPIYSIRTMEQLMAGALAPARFTLLLLAIFAGVSAVLTFVGIYGVMSNAVIQRTHEIGVRMALGADRRDVLRLVVGRLAAGEWSSSVPDRLVFEGRLGVRVGEPLAHAEAGLEAVLAAADDGLGPPVEVTWVTAGLFGS